MRNKIKSYLAHGIGWAVLSCFIAGGAYAQDSSVLRVAIPADIESMDPHLSGGLSMRVSANIYELLVSIDAEGNVEPRLAESWKPLDETHYEFKIRPGVKFTTGRDANAPAIAESFRVKNSPEAPHTHISFSKWIKSVEAPDDHTLIIETDGPFPAILNFLADERASAIYDAEARKEWGDLRSKSAGTGPFILDSLKPGASVELRRNPEYWGDAPRLEKVRFQVIPEEAARALALQRGEIDMTFDIGPASLERLKQSKDLSVDVSRSLRLLSVGFNFLKPLIRDNIEVRRAIALAIDKKTMVEELIGVLGDPADSMVVDKSSGYVSIPENLEFSPEKARAILDEAGWVLGSDGVRAKDGERLELTFVADITRDYRNRELAQAVQAYLSDVGIKINLSLLERGPFTTATVQKGEGWDVALEGWGGGNEPSSWVYTRLHSDNQALGSWGIARNRDPELDKLIDSARFEFDKDEANKKWAEVQHKIYDDAIQIPLYFANRITVFRNNVHGFTPHPDEWYGYRFNNISIEN